ncbi:MAG: DUF4230 domain-containing protein [Flavobacterium sp.]|nr:DUF4230 domain-containing protein [Candidatus Neoflavobacterium equi]
MNENTKSRWTIGLGMLVFMMLGAFIYHFYVKSSDPAFQDESQIIQEQLKNVSKLVVNEAKLSKIFTYKDQQSYMMNLISFDKKAMVVVDADVLIMYDLSKLTYEIDEKNKIVKITHIPEEEIKVTPHIKIYDVEQSTFNTFKGADYNKITEKVTREFNEKIKHSNLTKNAKNRLVSELAKFLVVTQSLGWTLEYGAVQINNQETLEQQIAL